LQLGPDDLAALEAAIPPGQVAGDRYERAQMAALDSEKRQS
jgi:pyridoxine 4-dehydrogenase